MSTAPAAEAAQPAKGKKKLMLIVVAAAVVLGGGGAAMMLMKKKADPEAEGGEERPAASASKEHGAGKGESKDVPLFVPLDPFTVNLADRNAERYAQVGVTLEIEDAHFADQIKNYMPAIRNNILLVIADRSAADLMGREGKAKLAERIRRAASRALGVEVEDIDEDDPDAVPEEPAPKSKKKKKKSKGEASMPIKAVHFSNIIIQ